jgi:hypothetical protein
MKLVFSQHGAAIAERRIHHLMDELYKLFQEHPDIYQMAFLVCAAQTFCLMNSK